MTYHPADNSLGCWELWLACKRAELVAGRKLTPAEALALVDAAGGPGAAPERERVGRAGT